jgi:NitT/TauT family transport system permease protein
MNIDAIKHFMLRSSGIVIFLILWETASRLHWVDAYFLPPFSVVVAEIGRLVADGSLISNLAISSVRALGGLTIALLLGLPAGFLLGRWFTGLASALDPLLRIMSQVNPFLVLMAFTLMIGYGEKAKFAVIAWVSVWPVLFYTTTAVRNVDPAQIKIARSLGISGQQLLTTILIPSALPTIFTGIRISAGITFFILVAVEMLNATSGLGWFEHNSAMNFEIPSMYAGATIIVVLGFLLNRFLIALEKGLFSWKSPDLVVSRTKPAPAAHPVWRPNLAGGFTAAALLLVALLAGGYELRKVNAERVKELAGEVEGKHARHMGSEVRKQENGEE